MPESAKFSKGCEGLAVVLCALSSGFLTGCRAAEAPPDRAQPEMRLENVHFRSYRGPALSSFGEATGLVYHRDTGDAVAQDAKVVLTPEGSAEVHLSAPVLAGNLPSRTYQARGGVVMDRGIDSARTATARYGADGIVRGDEPIELLGPGYRLSGPAFTLDPADGVLVIRGGVKLVATARGATRP